LATFDEWLAGYDIVYRTLPATSEVPCPNCGHRTLRLVFTGPRRGDYGYASFWCDTCLQGIHTGDSVGTDRAAFVGTAAAILKASRSGDNIPRTAHAYFG